VEKVCPFCKSRKYDGEYCRDCKKKPKKRSLLILIILFLLLTCSYPLVSNLGLYVSVNRDVLENVPYSVIKEANVTVPLEKYACQNISFRFTTSIGNVDSVGISVRPSLAITNKEAEWGFFSVNFSYIEEDKFPYDIYGGQNLSENIRTGKLSYGDAEFYSDNYVVLIGPTETVEIRNLTTKKDRSTQYWAIANIAEPKKTECNIQTTYTTITEEKVFTEYRKEKKTITVKEYRKISEVFGIMDFSEWFIILMLGFIILYMVLKIWEKMKELKENHN